MIVAPSSTEPALTVVVAMTAEAERARVCLRRLADAIPPDLATELVVVDNAARDDVGAVLRDELRGARVLLAREDLGIPATWNQAITASRAPRVLIIHEDTELQPETVPALWSALEADVRVGAVAARIHGTDGRVQSAGRVVWREGRDTPITGGERLDATTPFAVDRPSSAAMLLDRAALAVGGGFDEAFFPAVCVDADLGLALWEAGATVVCAPRARVVHASGAMIQADGGPTRSGVFSHFLQLRAYDRLATKWAARLAQHVPVDAGVDAALEAAADRGRRAPGIARRPAGDLAPPISAGGERRAVSTAVEQDAAGRRAALHEEFLAWSVARDGLLHTEIAWRDVRLADLEERTAFHEGYIAELSERIVDAAAYIERVEAHAAELRARLAQDGAAG